jgi:hypothetical protein
MSEEFEEGRLKFLELVREIDSAVQVVIPTKPANSLFLISLTKGANRKFITLPEDDILDLPTEAEMSAKVAQVVKDAVASL